VPYVAASVAAAAVVLLVVVAVADGRLFEQVCLSASAFLVVCLVVSVD
jgi:hypothetical protein